MPLGFLVNLIKGTLITLNLLMLIKASLICIKISIVKNNGQLSL